MKKILISSFVFITLAFFMFGCGQNDTQEFTQTQYGISAVFSMSPASPTIMEPVTLWLSLTENNGQAIEAAQVTYDLTMPGMVMLPNQPQAVDKGGGIYDAKTTFTMSGDWRAEVIVTYNDMTTSFTFDFTVK
jgi:hypothetical protein